MFFRKPISASKVTATASEHHPDQTEQGEIEIMASKIVAHPAYSFPFDDVAIVKLSKPLNFTDTVRPICLPSQGEDVPLGKTCMAAGWGKTHGMLYRVALLS